MASGGIRDGAGRPATRVDQKTVSIRLLPQYADKLKFLASDNKVSQGEMIEKMLDKYESGK